MGSPAATIPQRIDFQGFLSVALAAIQPPLPLRVLWSGCGPSPQTPRKHLLFLVGGHRVSGGWGWGPVRSRPGELMHCLLCSNPLDHLGQDKSNWVTTLPRTLDGSPLTTELLDLKPQSFISFSVSVHTHPLLLLTLLTLPNFNLQNAQNSCLELSHMLFPPALPAQVLAQVSLPSGSFPLAFPLCPHHSLQHCVPPVPSGSVVVPCLSVFPPDCLGQGLGCLVCGGAQCPASCLAYSSCSLNMLHN